MTQYRRMSFKFNHIVIFFLTGFLFSIAVYPILSLADETTISQLVLITEDGNQGELQTGATINPKHMNIVAEMDSPTHTVHVRFILSGPSSYRHTDARIPYTLFPGAGDNIALYSLAPGAYHLTVELIDKLNDDEIIDTKTVDFSVQQAGGDDGIRYYIFEDAISSDWDDSWLWNDLVVDHHVTAPDNVYQGSVSMSFSVPGNTWSAWHGWHDDFDTSNYTYLTFAAKSSVPGVPWHVYFLDESATVVGQDYSFASTTDWQVHTIDLQSAGVSHREISGIRFWHQTVDAPANILYVDAFGFGGYASPPPPIPEPANLTTTITVNADVFVNTFSNKMLGQALANWEHSWGKPFPGEVPGLAQAFKAADVGLIRYAGGLWANYVGWERINQRRPYTDWNPVPENYHPDFQGQINTGLTYSFHYGQDEMDSLAVLKNSSGAEVMIQVNINNSDPAMWADLVHYTNVEHNYDFKYWEIGNELDLEDALNISPEEYASRLQGYVDAMKAVDPTIIIVGGVPASGHEAPNQNWSDSVTDMSHYLHRTAEMTTPHGRKIDSLSFHWYQQSHIDSMEEITRYRFDGLDRDSWRNGYSRIWSEIAPSRIEAEIIAPNILGATMGITELNTDASDFDAAPQESNHLAAIWMADVLGRLAYNGLDYVTWYEGFGSPAQGYPMIVREPDSDDYTQIRLRPTYYTTWMYGNYFGDRMVQSVSGLPEVLSAWASTDTDDPGTLKLMIVNMSGDNITAPINIHGFASQSAEYYQLRSTDPTYMGNEGNLNSAWTYINWQKLTDMDVASSSIEPLPLDPEDPEMTFPPYSATSIIFSDHNDQSGDGFPPEKPAAFQIVR